MSNRSRRTSRRSNVFQRKALALAIGGSIALAFTGGAYAQATTGTIYGTVPVASGETIQITGGAGFNRTITVGPSGRYSIDLPVGTYTVSLLQNGKVVQSKSDVSPVAAGAVGVNLTLLQFSHPGLPFGGKGQSGQGQAHGRWGFDAFSHQMPVLENRFSPARLLMPPLGGKGRRLLALLLKWG